jgi:hypothetical protein
MHFSSHPGVSLDDCGFVCASSYRQTAVVTPCFEVKDERSVIPMVPPFKPVRPKRPADVLVR